MKPALFCAAISFALFKVSASPIRVIHKEELYPALSAPGFSNDLHPAPANPVIRFGHAVPSNNNNNDNTPALGVTFPHLATGRMRGPCRGLAGTTSQINEKAIEVANAFRGTFGFALIEAHPHSQPQSVPAQRPADELHILPFIGTPSGLMLARPNNNKNVMGTLLLIEEGGQPSGFPWSHWEKYDFVTRLHYALVSLGAWEGRAVAFVLGCGLGVLLRMMWVLAVVSYRSVFGPSASAEDEVPDGQYEYTAVVMLEQEDAAPPAYETDRKKAEETE